MTSPNPPAAFQQAAVEAALLILERMGLSPGDLISVRSDRKPVPTFAEYVPVVSAAVTDGTRKAYGSYWNRVTEQWGGRRLDEPTHRGVLPAGPGPGHGDRPGPHAPCRCRREDRSGTTNDAPDRGTGGPAGPRSARWSPADQAAGVQAPVLSGDRTARPPCRDHRDTAGPVTAPAARTALNTYPEPDETRPIARRLAAAGKPVSRRTLRSNGATGSNAQLGTLALSCQGIQPPLRSAYHPACAYPRLHGGP